MGKPRARPELAFIRVDEATIAKLEAEAAKRGITRRAVTDDVLDQYADELEGKPPRVPPLVPVRFSCALGARS